jgi:hypothetical protein
MKHANTRWYAAPVVLVVTAVVALNGVLAGQGRGRPSDTAAISTLEDQGNAGDETNYRIQSDGLGDYINGVDDVSSIIQTSNTCCNDWILATGGSNRGILVDFRDSAGGSAAPFDWQVVPARIIVQCHHVSSTSFPGMETGDSLLCPMSLTFPASKKNTWKVAGGFPAYPNLPGTDLVLVTCIADDELGCREWTLEPGATHDGELKNKVALLLVSGNTVLENRGHFYMSFSFRVTRP